MGSVESSFQFIGYKIDKTNVVSIPSLNVLHQMGNINGDRTNLDIGFRNPVFFEKDRIYVCGIDLKIEIFNDSKKNKDEIICNGEVGIAGSFKIDEGKLEKKVEEQLVKIQLPTILFPYLRGFISSFFAHAGFGSIILPLINVPNLAQEAQKTFEIQRIPE